MPTGYRAVVDETEIIKLYESGLSCNQIAKLIGYSERVPYLIIKRAGIMRSRQTSLNMCEYPDRTKQVTITCQYCNKSFEVVRHEATLRKFCSRECSLHYQKEHNNYPKPGPTLPIICKTCGHTFYRIPYIAKKQKFCSTACARYYQHINNKRWANTTIERIIQALLEGLNISYERQWRLKQYSADFYLPDYHKAIECDGDYWHKLPITVKTDLAKEQTFKSENIPVLHLTETEINTKIKECKDRILEFIST